MEVDVTEERSLPGGCQSQQWSQSDIAIRLLYQLLGRNNHLFRRLQGVEKERKKRQSRVQDFALQILPACLSGIIEIGYDSGASSEPFAPEETIQHSADVQ